LVKIFHDFGKVRLGKVFRTETSIEGRETEIDGIGSGGNGSFEALPIACRGEEFRFMWRGHPKG